MAVIDTFTDTDATALTSHTPSGGGSWTKHASFSSGAADIRSGRARCGTSESVFYYSQAVDRTYYCEAIVRRVTGSTAGMYGGICAVETGAKTLYEVDVQSTGIYLGKYVAGTYSSLGQYLFTAAADTSYTVKLSFNGTTVDVYLDGTNRISVTDSSVTVARFGVYGGTNTSSAGFHVDDFSIALMPVAPTTGTLSGSGTLGGVTLGCNLYGMAVMGYTEGGGDAPTSFTIERSADGGTTWANVTTNCSYAVISGTNWKIIDRRPQYGGQATTWGGSAKYRVTPTNAAGSGSASSTVTIASLTPDKRAVILQRGASHHAFMAGSYVASQAGAYYPADTMVDMAVAYLESVRAGSPEDGWRADVMTQFAYIRDTLTNADDLIRFPAYNTKVYIDHHGRTTHYAAAAAACLYKAGATTDAQTIITQVDKWAKAMFDKLGGGSPLSSVTWAGRDADNQTAWSAGASIAAGEIRRPTSTNGRSYRAMNAGTTGGSQPTLPTSTGGTVTDNGITWRETSATGSLFYETYDTSAGYPGTSGKDPGSACTLNQQLGPAAMFAALCSNALSAFASAGTYRTKALAYIADAIGTATAIQYTNGGVALGAVGDTANNKTADTLYGGYVAQSAALISGFFPGQHPAQALWLSRLADWLLTYYGGSEPLTAVHINTYDADGSQDPDGPFEVIFPYNVALLLSKSTGNMENLALSGAFWDESTKRWGDYDANGAVDSYPAGGSPHTPGPYPAISQNTLDSYAIYESLFTVVIAGQGSETDTALGISPVANTTIDIGQATETDTGLTATLTANISITTGIGSETDTGLPITPNTPTPVNVGLASETDDGLFVTHEYIENGFIDDSVILSGSDTFSTSITYIESSALDGVSTVVGVDDFNAFGETGSLSGISTLNGVDAFYSTSYVYTETGSLADQVTLSGSDHYEAPITFNESSLIGNTIGLSGVSFVSHEIEFVVDAGLSPLISKSVDKTLSKTIVPKLKLRDSHFYTTLATTILVTPKISRLVTKTKPPESHKIREELSRRS